MAVGANHVALRHLFEDSLPRTLAEAPTDAELLVSSVIELEHLGIGLTAIAARVLA